MIYAYQILMILFIVFSARQQGRTHKGNAMLSNEQRKRWHFDGLATYCLMCAIPVYECWVLILPALMIRVALFDTIYSEYAGLRPDYIGDGKEFSERLAIKIFGNEGGVIKAYVFMAVLLVLNILNYYLFHIKI